MLILLPVFQEVPYMLERGFYTVVTPDRFDDLRRMVKSLRRFSQNPIQVCVVHDFVEAHRMKAWAGAMSPFKATIILDTDMYVNGCLAHLFRAAEGGKICAYYEEGPQVWNTGMLAFNQELGFKLAYEWGNLFDQRVSEVGRSKAAQQWEFYDQYSFNQIVRNARWRVLMFKQEDKFNYILKLHSPEQEASYFDSIKVFHFLHDGVAKLEEYRSYKEWLEL